ncbi:hypothetical protein BBAD15_g1090 [Beauveria bassiana D1-5]|uniref:Uncharacterized protein n=1 Tax=Beauveria bassiana D1-5 TaxID=1245745 RepID=A0A0A2VZ77_BEABA|nr:hypothetical protein BBAD15_g1090 [Beauveria bassiana D1-5]
MATDVVAQQLRGAVKFPDDDSFPGSPPGAGQCGRKNNAVVQPVRWLRDGDVGLYPLADYRVLQAPPECGPALYFVAAAHRAAGD